MRSSLYPVRPPDSRVVVAPPPDSHSLSLLDRALVYLSSLTFVGSIVWVPAFYCWVYRRWKSIPRDQPKLRAIYAGFLTALIGVGILGPHRREKIGQYIRFGHWNLWHSWLKYFAFEVIYDYPAQPISDDWKSDQVIMAMIPHGIFPFSLGLAALPQPCREAFGKFRPVVATATNFLPIIRSFLSWIHGVCVRIVLLQSFSFLFIIVMIFFCSSVMRRNVTLKPP